MTQSESSSAGPTEVRVVFVMYGNEAGDMGHRDLETGTGEGGRGTVLTKCMHSVLV